MADHRQKTANIRSNTYEESKREFKRELLNVFKKFGYLNGDKDYEIKIRTTSGNIAWININRIEIIK